MGVTVGLFRRAPSIRAYDRGETTTVLARDGTAREFYGDSALLVRELLRLLVEPQSMESILAHLDAVANGVSESRPAIEDALRMLQVSGAITPFEPVTALDPMKVTGRLVLGITGAVAAAHTPQLAGRLLSAGFDVRIAMTRAARRFVSAEALEALVHQRVNRSLWSGAVGSPAPHIDLAAWAEVVLVAPASATTLSRIARGDCSDLVSAVALATRAPVVLATSMNTAMHDAAPIARNAAQLVEDGFFVLHPSSGIEVAEPPQRRRARFGSWPAMDDLVATVEHIWRRSRQHAEGVVAAGEVAARWEATYAQTPAERLPFHTDSLDGDILQVLEQVKRPATLWDVGTGLGTIAREASQLGFTATGTDISPHAIALARERAGAGSAKYLVDDVRASKVEGTFDVIVDRGCFHTLDTESTRAWVEIVRERTRPGSLVVLKIHREEEPGDWRTIRYRLGDLERLFAPHFALSRWSRSTFPGHASPEPLAWLAVFERVDP
jgi:SAM-dependent methyltransferase/3-polyprenyl-4-hydroxybenzoate decarboxylase